METLELVILTNTLNVKVSLFVALTRGNYLNHHHENLYIRRGIEKDIAFI